ncbi:MAG TPA: membrane dipeptidase [Humisphaera sp.]
MLIVDAHLDLAYNALRGRDVLAPADAQKPDEEGIPTVGLPDLRAGGVGLVCATVFAEPSINGKPGYRTADEAHAAGLAQREWYRQREGEGHFRFVRSAADLSGIGAGGGSPSPLPAILLLEGADPLRTPADVAEWFAAGMRIVGLAWRRTRYAGGTNEPGPLSPAGVDLVRELDRFGVIHDASHLAEEAFWQLLDLSAGPVIASHSNCRAFVPTDRQLSDEMATAVARRGGVIGINFYDRFLLRPTEYKTRRATLADVVEHVRRFCDLAGDAAHVGLGTDMDGGLGREQIPQEIRTSADLPRVADALSAAGFGDTDVQGIMGGNWIRFFREKLAG